MSARWWTPLSIALILLSFIAFGFLSRRPLCIDSKFVEKIDRVSESGQTATVYRCGLHRAVPYDEEWSQSVIPLSRRIQSVEKFLESLAPQKGFVRVTVTEKDQPVFRIDDHEISMSLSFLTTPGSIEKALIKSWLRDHSGTSLAEHSVFEESLTDLLLFAVDGELSLVDPELKVGPDLNRTERWPFVVKSMAGYCRSSWRQFEHLKFCQTENLDHGVRDPNIIPLSLRPLLSQSMISAYMNLSLREQRRFLSSMISVLASLKFEEKEIGFSSMDSSQQSFVDVSFEISGVMRALGSAARAFEAKQSRSSFYFSKWVNEFTSQIEARGFSDQIGEAQLDHLVAFVGINSERHVAGLSKVAAKLTGAAIAITDKEQIYLLPSVEPVKKSLFNKLRASRMTLVNCGGVTLAELDKYSEMTDRLTVVENCDESVEINFEGLVSGEVGRFSLQNPQVSFVEIHLPSLHLALEKRKLNLATKLAMNFDNQNLNQALGWESPTYDANIKAYKANSAIEAFQVYRPRQKIN